MSDARSMPRTKKRISCGLTAGGRRSPGIVLDVSASGVFIQTSATPEPGEQLEIDLSLPAGESLRLVGRVVRREHVAARLKAVVKGGIGVLIERAPEQYFTLVAEALAHAPSSPQREETGQRHAARGGRKAQPAAQCEAEPEAPRQRTRSKLLRESLLARLRRLRSEAS